MFFRLDDRCWTWARAGAVTGFDLLEPEARFRRFNEGMEVVTRLLQSNQSATFEGQYYQLRGGTLLQWPELDDLESLESLAKGIL